MGYGYAVFDGFLSEAMAAAAWHWIVEGNFRSTHAQGLEKVFRFGDGQSYVGDRFTCTRDSQGHPVTHRLDGSRQRRGLPPESPAPVWLKDFGATVFDCCSRSDLFAEFATLKFSPYIYPPGSGLGWHSDGDKIGAFIYYAHPLWKQTWGGELLISDRRFVASQPPEGTITFDSFYATYNHDERDFSGIGTFVTPRPNRLVLLAPGVGHSIKKVEAAAGDSFRASIAGFLS